MTTFATETLAETHYVGAALDEIIHATNPQEANEQFAKIVDCLDRTDMQADRAITLEYQRDEVMDAFMEDPFTSAQTEMDWLSQVYEGRSLTRFDGLQTVTEFITRNATNDAVDAVYRQMQNEGSQRRIGISTKLQGQLGAMCTFKAADGELSVSEKYYGRGQWHTFEHSTTEGTRGIMLQRALFGSTLWASHLALTRSAEEVQSSDAGARRMLEQYRTDARSV